MRRGWTVLAVVTMFLLAACQGGGDDASDGADGSGATGDGIEIDEAAVTGTVRFSGFRSSDAEEELLQATLDAFSAKYPNIEVDYEPIPEGYIDQMTAQFSAGEPPDLFYVQAEFANAWIEDGLLEPLDPYFAGNPGVRHRAVLRSADRRPSSSRARRYGLPKDASPLALFYNPDMLAAAGVEASDARGTSSRRPPRR